MKITYTNKFKSQTKTADPMVTIHAHMVRTFTYDELFQNVDTIITGDWILNDELAETAHIFVESIIDHPCHERSTFKANDNGTYTARACFTAVVDIENGQIVDTNTATWRANSLDRDWVELLPAIFS